MKIFLAFFVSVISLFANFEINSIESKFNQIITNEQNSTIIYSGKFYAKKSNQALWIYKTPVKKKIYFSSERVVVVEPELEQAIFSRLDKSPNILEIWKNAKKIGKDTFLAKCCDNDYTITVSGEKIQTIKYKDKMENSVIIEFFEQNTNLFLDDTIFKIDIPMYYDIIKN